MAGTAPTLAFGQRSGLCYILRVLPSVPNVWDQYPGEIPGDYSLFLKYLELGVARTVANVTRSSAGYTYSYVLALSKAWLWSERAAEYDAMMLAQRRETFTRLEAEKAERWSHDQLELAELATQVLRTELISLAQRQAEGRPLGGTVMTQLMDRVHKWLQLATGGKTDDVRTTFDVTSLPQAQQDALQSPEVRAALEQIAKG